MRAVIVGSGRVGAGLAGTLARHGHDVTILDVQTDAFSRLDPSFPGRALRGDGTDIATLRRAGADGADWFFALTNGDNRNVLAAQLAAETFGIANVVAKVNDPVRAEAYAAMGIHTIDRTTWMVDALTRFMGTPGKPGATDVRAADEEHAHAGPDHVRPAGEAVAPAAHRVAAGSTGGL
jgi:trk system potassium uptake protein TrkA